MPKSYLNWSTGKDAALALYRLSKDPQWEVSCLLSSMNAHYDRISMHGLRRTLWQAQVDAIGIPHRTVELPELPSMEVYAAKMQAAVAELKADGFTHSIFGDIFLEDLRQYREDKLQELGISCHFPLWQEPTKELLLEFIALGFRAIVVAVDARKLPPTFAGRLIDESFLADLPQDVDPCGENGEFHSFCFDGPIFKYPVPFELGERVARSYPDPTGTGEITFFFQDLKPLAKP